MFIKWGLAEKSSLGWASKEAQDFSRQTGKVTEEEGICKTQKQESAKVQKNYWRGRDSYSNEKDSCAIHLPICPESSILSTQDGTKFAWGRMERRGWKMTMSIVGKGNRRVRDPGQGAITGSSLKLLHPHHISWHRVQEHQSRQWSRSGDRPFSP